MNLKKTLNKRTKKKNINKKTKKNQDKLSGGQSVIKKMKKELNAIKIVTKSDYFKIMKKK